MTEHEPRRAAPRSAYYDEYWSPGSWKPTDALDDELAPFLEELLAPGTMMLDVGCGDGSRYAREIIAAGVELHGVDVSEVAVEEARSRGVKAVRAGLEERLPFGDAEFDTALCLEVFEHLVDPEFAAREIHRVLRPGGRLLVSVPNVSHWRIRVELLVTGHFDPKGSPATARRYPWRDPHLRFFSNRSLANMLGDTGFEVVRQGGLDTQFLTSAPGLRRLVRTSSMLDGMTRALGRRYYALLAGRCVALVVKASAREVAGE